MGYINWENIKDYAFVNTDTLKGTPKGVAVNLHGYTDGTMLQKSNAFATAMAKSDIVFVFPYYSVWAWMSKSSLSFIDEVLDVVYSHYGLDNTTPLVVCGGSMGGMTSILYGLYGRRKPVACAANCPVTDLEKIFERSPDMRRAIYSAHNLDGVPFEESLVKFSPIKQIPNLPKIPYHLVFGSKDTGISSDGVIFVTEMKKNGFDIHSKIVDDMGHCNLLDFPEDFSDYMDFVTSTVYKNR